MANAPNWLSAIAGRMGLTHADDRRYFGRLDEAAVAIAALGGQPSHPTGLYSALSNDLRAQPPPSGLLVQVRLQPHKQNDRTARPNWTDELNALITDARVVINIDDRVAFLEIYDPAALSDASVVT